MYNAFPNDFTAPEFVPVPKCVICGKETEAHKKQHHEPTNN